MELFSTVGGVIITLMIMSVAGFSARKAGIFPIPAADSMSKMVLYVTLPCYLFKNMALKGAGEALNNVPYVFLITIVFYFVIILLSRFLFLGVKDLEHRRIYGLGFIFGNVGFMGFPVVNVLLGSEAFMYTVIFNFTFNLLLCIVPHLYYGGTGLSVKKIMSAVFAPMMIGVYLSVAVYLLDITVPAPIDNALGMLGEATTPLAFLVIGARFADVKPKDFKQTGIYFFFAVRMLIMPALVYAVMNLLGIAAVIVQTAVVMAAVPISASLINFVQIHNGDATYTSLCIALTHLFSLLTIPLVAILLL